MKPTAAMLAKAPVLLPKKGKQHSRCNAVRHGLTAETVIGALADAEDYQEFESAVTAGFDAETAVERELVSGESAVAFAACDCN